MNGLMPHITTATEIQRNYRKVKTKAKKTKEPIAVLTNNEPDLVVVDYTTFIRDYKKRKRSKNDNVDNFDEFFGVWSRKEGEEFDKFIEEAFEQVHPEDWQ